MKNILKIMVLSMILAGCTYDPVALVDNKKLTVLVNEKYENRLNELDVKTLNCIVEPSLYTIYASKESVNIIYKASIVLIRKPTTFKLYFSDIYLKKNPQNLLDDIDGCVRQLEKETIESKEWHIYK